MSRKKIPNRNSSVVGPRIKALRKRLGLTQEVFASRLDLTQGYISKLEKGEQTPSFEVLLGFAVLGFDMNFLFKGEGDREIKDSYLRQFESLFEPDQSPSPEDSHVTVVSQEEMAHIHNLLRVLRRGDDQTSMAIKLNLEAFVRLMGYMNRFTDVVGAELLTNMIILDRREQNLRSQARKSTSGRKTDPE